MQAKNPSLRSSSKTASGPSHLQRARSSIGSKAPRRRATGGIGAAQFCHPNRCRRPGNRARSAMGPGWLQSPGGNRRSRGARKDSPTLSREEHMRPRRNPCPCSRPCVPRGPGGDFATRQCKCRILGEQPKMQVIVQRRGGRYPHDRRTRLPRICLRSLWYWAKC